MSQSLKRHFFCTVRNKILNIIFARYSSRLALEKANAEARYFSGEKANFYAKYCDKILVDLYEDNSEVNNDNCVLKIRELKPDLIIVFGAALIGQDIIDIPKLALNLHTGLSPYFRGGYSNLWPYIEKKRNFTGFTIHKLSKGIDRGDIYRTELIKRHVAATYSEINCGAIVVGTKAMLETVVEVETNNFNLSFVSQWTPGLLFNDRDFNGYIAFKYFNSLQSVAEKVESGIDATDKIKLVMRGKLIE